MLKLINISKRIKRAILFIACSFMLLSTHAASAQNETALQYVPDAQLVGEGRMTYMVWDVYDAALYAPHGKWTGKAPYMLKLSYLKDLKGKNIAEHAMDEIHRISKYEELSHKDDFSNWLDQMKRIFPDVKAGDDITGILTEQGSTIFMQGDKELGTINDPAFGEAFFGIWLSPQTATESLRDKLLAQVN